MTSLPSEHLHLVYDDVLIRSAVEYWRALQVMEQVDTSEQLDVINDIRQDLDMIENELQSRGIDVSRFLCRDGDEEI